MPEKYTCPMCRMDFPTEEALKKHAKEAHGK
jgi:hypothetical protein